VILNKWCGALLIVVLVIALVQTVRLDEAQLQGKLAGLVADAREAAADTSRDDIYVDAAAVGDSLRVAERRAIQTVQRADALDKALGIERRVRDSLIATVERMSRAVESEQVVADSADEERRAAFEVRETPFTVYAKVMLPRAPQTGTMDVRVDLDTLGLDVRVGCGARATAGVRPATASVAGPVWAKVRLTRVEQAPEVCAGDGTRARGEAMSPLRWVVRRFGVSLGYGAVREMSGAVVAGPGGFFGFRVWP
jgi:hypothetical protein